MKRTILTAMALYLFTIAPMVFAENTDNFSTSPTTNNGKKWAIGYYEGGDYIEYKQTFIATIKGLMSTGWIETAPFPDFTDTTTRQIWQWCADHLKSNYLDFRKDAYYSSDWKVEIRKQQVKVLLQRLNTTKDIDLMIAMGTWAGQDLANDQHHTPTVALAISDALSSGIIKSYDNSGFDHIHARVDPLRYKRQVEIFHDIMGFQKLGIMYEDSLRGRSYASVDKIESVARERGFEIIRCFIQKGVEDKAQAEKEAIRCFAELCKSADAIYVTLHMGINTHTLPTLVETANQAGIPTFSQAGSQEVKYGLLMSISQAEFKYVGQYHADTIAKIFNGAKPGELDQFFEEPSQIALNLKTASKIGYDPSVDILSAADEIYNDYLE